METFSLVIYEVKLKNEVNDELSAIGMEGKKYKKLHNEASG
jgi:hypothetical protein